MFILVPAYFFPLLLLPESVIGHRDDNMMLFTPKVLFLAVTAAIMTIFALIFIFRNDYVKAQLDTLNRFKYYLRLLIKRDFNARYRKSILGVLWSLLNPLLMMIVMTLVFSYMFRFEIENFPVYLLSGMIIYSFFSESTTLAMHSVIASEGVIKKVYVPKYMFPLSRVISSLVNLLFSSITFLLVVFFTRAPLNWTLLLIPIPIFYTFIFSLGVAMLISSLAVFFRDLVHLYSVFTLMLMYLTPIFWPTSELSGIMVYIIGFNPLFQFVNYFRYLALWGTVPDLWTNFVCIGFALSSLCIGTFVFMKQQDKYILHL